MNKNTRNYNRRDFEAPCKHITIILLIIVIIIIILIIIMTFFLAEGTGCTHRNSTTMFLRTIIGSHIIKPGIYSISEKDSEAVSQSAFLS